MSNSFGHLFRITTWGESHGEAVGVVIVIRPHRPVAPVAFQWPEGNQGWLRRAKLPVRPANEPGGRRLALIERNQGQHGISFGMNRKFPTK